MRVFTIVQDALCLEQEARVHDFGVNCIASIELDDGKQILATGGDDQHVNVMEWVEGELRVATRWQAHSSCVKGVGLYDRADKEVLVCSSGYDQRFKVWQTNGKPVRTQRHCLSDMNAMHLANGKAHLVGQGIFTIKLI